jgi:hypothetical protein
MENNFKKINFIWNGNQNNNDIKILNNSLLMASENIKEFQNIDTILKTLKTYFKEESNDFILNILDMTSFNIELTFKILQYKKENKDISKFLFTNSDDYIIQNMNHLNIYEELKKIKGKNFIEERKKYLGIEDDEI